MDKGRIDGIEWLRAAMSIFVVAWHLGGGGKSLIWTDRFAENVFTISDFVNFHILLLAVPTFMLISNYLLAKADPDAATALKRARRVGVLALFWPIMLTIFQGGWNGLVANIPDSPLGWLVYVLTAGQTVYYFFVSVLITYGLTFLANRLPLAVNVALLAVSVLALGLAPMVSIANGWPLLCAYWSPVNFIPYAFAGVVILRLFDRDASPGRAFAAVTGLLMLGAAFAVAEWRYYPNAVFFPGQYVNIPAYTRPSLVAVSMALMILAVRWNPGVPSAIAFMAKYSLALYCLHLFLVEPMRLLVQRFGAALPGLGQTWILIALTVLTSYLAAKTLSVVWKDKLLF